MKKVLIAASVVSFIEWFNKENVEFLKNELGCEVHVACNFDYTDDTDVERTEKYVAKLRADGFVLRNVPFARGPLSPSNVAAYRALKKIIDAENFDLIHCHTPAASVLTRLAARKARKRGAVVIYSCHGFHFHNAAPKKNWAIYYPIERFLARFCDYIVAINKEDFNRAKTFRCKNARYIPGVGVDVNGIRNLVVDKAAKRRELGLPDDAILILSLGELIERKNHEVIIRALGKLKNPKIYYAIGGKGPLKESLEKLANDLGVGERTLFLGFRTDGKELCRVADISAFPSRIEGLGLAGIEAMAAGVPLVSSNVHGILDYVVDGETGYALPPNDVDGFAEAIDRLASNPELRKSMQEKCFEATKPFEISNALNAMWDIYREVLGDERRVDEFKRA